MTLKPQGNPGFTLLEALVVLIITGLVSVALVQGFGLVLAARTSVQNKLVDIDQAVLQRNLVLEPLRGVLPDYPDRLHMFSGDARRISGLTARSLQSRMGVPIPFSMTMTYDGAQGETLLTYQEEGAGAQVIAHWPGDQGAFAYRDRTGDWLPAWPPPPAPESTPQTPWVIRVEMGAEFPATVVASVDGPHQRRIRLADTPFGPDVRR